MCEDTLFNRFQKNHELHFLLIGALVYSQTKNMYWSGGLAGVAYYYMRQKENRNKVSCGCKRKELKIVDKTLTNY